jgi:hypothetical protein
VQSLVILKKDHTEDELRMVYDYLLFLDNSILNMYYNNNTIPGFQNDLYIYIEVVNETIKVFEKTEEYEKCFKLKLKRDEALKIINKN